MSEHAKADEDYPEFISRLRSGDYRQFSGTLKVIGDAGINSKVFGVDMDEELLGSAYIGKAKEFSAILADCIENGSDFENADRVLCLNVSDFSAYDEEDGGKGMLLGSWFNFSNVSFYVGMTEEQYGRLSDFVSASGFDFGDIFGGGDIDEPTPVETAPPEVF